MANDKRALIALVKAQAEDEGLWFRPVYISEDYLQQALRQLHDAVEAAFPAFFENQP